jgi:chemotaxis protein MotB
MAGKGGGAWKVAYADFVTAMMAFFMVMWLVAQGGEQAEKVRESVATYFRDPRGSFATGGALLPPTMGTHPPDVSAGTANEDDKDKNRNGSAKPVPKVAFATNRGERTRMGTIILFDEDTADMSDEGQIKLDGLVPILAGKPQKIEIRGHALRRPPAPDSPYRDAWQLAYARCINTMQYLEEHGVSPERIRLSQAGPYEPFTIDSDPARVKFNSCVEIFLLAEMTSSFVGTESERAKRFVNE